MRLLKISNDNKGALDELATLVRRGSPLALVGAGLSVSAGLPTWPKLLAELHRHLPHGIKGPNRKYRAALRKEDDLPWRADEYRNYIGEDSFRALLSARFGSTVSVTKRNPAVALVKLPFRHLITTNYDDVLMKAHKVAGLPAPEFLNWNDAGDVRKFIYNLRGNSSRRFLLHLHGHHTSPDSIVLTYNDYTERYVRTASTIRRLFAIFATEQVVFVGFSLNDPDLMALLREVNAMLGYQQANHQQARHYAIMGLEPQHQGAN